VVIVVVVVVLWLLLYCCCYCCCYIVVVVVVIVVVVVVVVVVIVVSVCRDKHHNIFVVCLKDKGSRASDRILWESNVLRALQTPLYLHNRGTLSIYR